MCRRLLHHVEAAVLVEANISIDVDTKFRKELGLIENRLASLD